ncbi:hypothetical protein AL072_22680 [Azospirillum thiophilum]|uniref:Uncharacterized protein n=1 Tax=Azospirillum thiophilum TaxID=528244 RepID=A0AAC8W298_9PROT|nr:hypothetical protein AL072_22680 [Azospirillum thiophilum]
MGSIRPSPVDATPTGRSAMMQDTVLTAASMAFGVNVLLLTLAASGRCDMQSRLCRVRIGQRRRAMAPFTPRHDGCRWEGTPP